MSAFGEVSQLDLQETRDWLEIVYSEAPGLFNIVSYDNWTGRCFNATQIEEALQYVTELDFQGTQGIYLRATTLTQPPEKHKRGGEQLSSHLTGLWGDIDIAGPGHKTGETLPPDVDAALAVVAAAGLPEPSHWVHSGGGLYPWWLLRTAFPITDLERIQILSNGWQKALEHGAKKLGFHYGRGVGDLARVLRLPGTVNRKAGLKRPCTALKGHAWSGYTFTLEQLEEALERALELIPPPPEPARQPSRLAARLEGDIRPGDDFNNRMHWLDVLPGWTWLNKQGDKTFLRRPGKTDGKSASLSDASGRLFVFTESAAPFESWKHYSKFEAYALLEHNGDFSAAARELGRKGFGTQRSHSIAESSYVAGTLPTPTNDIAVVPVRMQTPSEDTTVAVRPTASVVPWKSDWSHPFVAADAFKCEEFTNLGAANIYAETFEDIFKYSAESKKWYFWDGRIWGEDRKERFEAGVKYLLAHARIQAKQATAADEEYAKELSTWVTRMSRAMSPNIARWARSDPRITVAPEEFDENRYLITTTNGVYDLGTNTFQDTHDPKMLLSKQIRVSYDKDATAPRWDKFLSQVLPDPAVRDYVQRAIGHTLLGDAEQRALFLCHGESGSGKSQFVKVMELLFGDYAETAQPNTFNATSKSATITNDLNDLRGKRFVSVSELDEGERLNESLVKRLTGGDTAKSRGLYQENKQWRVEFALWMATNHLPRLNSDDNAMWRRVKPIHFPTVAADNGGEILRLAEKIFAEEASGILNWVLEGVRRYQENGLQDLEQITTAVETYRREVDVVAQFLDAAVEENLLTTGDEASIPARNLHAMYRDWSQRNGHRYPLGEWRFGLRIQAMGYERRKTKAANLWIGLASGGHGFLGTMAFKE